MIEDAELLRRYAASHAEDDFAELVRRHVNLVYSCALRQVNGDAHLAQDVSQLVFADLARKAATVANHRVLAGWLFTSTRFAAAKAVRGEQRRHAREAAAQLMQDLNRDPAAQLDWGRVRPVLDDVLGELGDSDREAILLRFFEGRDFAGVGAKLNVNDNTARMRVERALDKLRAHLERRGVTSTSAALSAVLANQAIVAAPAGIAATITGAALASAAAPAAGAAAGAGAFAAFMSMTKLQLGLTGALAVAGATGLVVQAKSNAALRGEIISLRQDNAAVADLQAENLKLARTAAEVADLRTDDTELARLSDESAALKTRLQKVAQAERIRGTGANFTGEVYDLSQLDMQPTPRSQVRPQYPFALRRAGVGGEATVDFVVDPEGNVINPRAVNSGLTGESVEGVVKMSPYTVAGPATETKLTVNGVSTAEARRLIEEAAVAAVSQWKFKPGQKGGQKVGTHMQIPIVFTLNEESGGRVQLSEKN